MEVLGGNIGEAARRNELCANSGDCPKYVGRAFSQRVDRLSPSLYYVSSDILVSAVNTYR